MKILTTQYPDTEQIKEHFNFLEKEDFGYDGVKSEENENGSTFNSNNGLFIIYKGITRTLIQYKVVLNIPTDLGTEVFTYAINKIKGKSPHYYFEHVIVFNNQGFGPLFRQISYYEFNNVFVPFAKLLEENSKTSLKNKVNQL